MDTTSLRTLLQSVADRGVSTRQMTHQVEEAAKHTGTAMKLSHSTAAQILSGTYRSRPTEATIKAIAYLAGVSEETAYTAAGMPSSRSPFAQDLPEGVDRLSPKRRKVALEVLRSLLEAEDQEHELREVKKTTDTITVTEEAKVIEVQAAPPKPPSPVRHIGRGERSSHKPSRSDRSAWAASTNTPETETPDPWS